MKSKTKQLLSNRLDTIEREQAEQLSKIEAIEAIQCNCVHFNMDGPNGRQPIHSTKTHPTPPPNRIIRYGGNGSGELVFLYIYLVITLGALWMFFLTLKQKL